MATKVMLNHAGKEYFHVPVTGLPSDWAGGDGEMQIRFPPSSTWVAMEWCLQDPTTGLWSTWDGHTGLPTHSRVLIGGPDSSGATITLALGSFIPEMKLSDDPEVIIRTSPVVVVVFSS
jgi:hypothetical protein